MLLLSWRAILPDGGESDAVWYHLAYAQDWVTAGKIVVDPFMVFPFFANNFLLFFAAAIAFGLSAFLNFVSWATGLLIALGTYAFVRDGDEAGPAPPRAAIATLAALSVMVTTTFLDMSVLGYVDVPIGAFALLSAGSIVLALRDRSAAWLAVSAVTAGFLVGMKGSFVLLVPIYAIALWWAARELRVSTKTAAVAIALLCVTSAPWYVRNLIVAGDPIAPVINLALYHDDGLISPAEWESLDDDLHTSHAPGALISLPVRAYADPTGRDFREYGVSALILLIYVPTLVWLASLALRRRLRPEIAIPIFTLSGFVAYYLVTSTLLRYSLLFYPLLAFCVGALAVEACRRWPKATPAVVALVALTVLPTLGDQGATQSFLEDDFLRDYGIVVHRYHGQEAYLERYQSGYREEQFLAAWMLRHGYSGNVYVVGPHLDYYFRAAGVRGVGDYTGPAGYFRLLKAIDAGRGAEFLEDLDAHAVMLGGNNLIDRGVETLLGKQLRKAGYDRVIVPRSTYQIYVRTG